MKSKKKNSDLPKVELPPPISCSICDENTRTNPKLTFHRFPNSYYERQAWLKALRTPNWSPSNHDRICGRHFSEKCFIKSVQLNRVRLHETAIPTLLIPRKGFYRAKLLRLNRLPSPPPCSESIGSGNSENGCNTSQSTANEESSDSDDSVSIVEPTNGKTNDIIEILSSDDDDEFEPIEYIDKKLEAATLLIPQYEKQIKTFQEKLESLTSQLALCKKENMEKEKELSSILEDRLLVISQLENENKMYKNNRLNLPQNDFEERILGL